MSRDDRETGAVERRDAEGGADTGAVEADAWDDAARDDGFRENELRDDETRYAEADAAEAETAEPELDESGFAPARAGAETAGAETAGAEPVGADAGQTEFAEGPRAPQAVEADAEPTTTAADVGDSGTGLPAEHHDLPATPAGDGDPLIAPDQEHRFLERWSQAQISFVDDPHRAVSEAETLLEEIVTAQRTAVEARRASMNEQCHDTAADTEDLRLAMRGYGQLVSSLLSHAG